MRNIIWVMSIWCELTQRYLHRFFDRYRTAKLDYEDYKEQFPERKVELNGITLARLIHNLQSQDNRIIQLENRLKKYEEL